MEGKQIPLYSDTIIQKLEYIFGQKPDTELFIVTGQTSFYKSGAELLFKPILNKYPFFRYSEFSENPKIEDVENGIRLFKKRNFSHILALGGGSVIDMAKMINIGQADGLPFKEMVLGKRQLYTPGRKLIAVPTTSGSGSEATHFAAVYIDDMKYSVAHKEFLLPDMVGIIPELTYSLNEYQTAVTGLDAFSQAIESYWSINSTPQSRSYAREAIPLILKYLPLAVKDGSDREAREKMSIASNLAGKAINISKTTGAHAISYTLTSRFKIPHGHAVALTLGEWFKFNSDPQKDNILDARGIEFVNHIMDELSSLIRSQYLTIEDFYKGLGIKTRLTEFGIRNEDIESILEEINLERLSNNPYNISRDEIRKMLFSIL